MYGVNSGVAKGLRWTIYGLVVIVTVLAVGLGDADARGRRRRAVNHSGYNPPYASIVVDGNSGRVLQESNADSLRHPASLTKVMTLYLLFERLEAGKIKLGTVMTTSAHAAAQSPTKLGLRPGEGLKVEDAIRGIVTRSANDAAVVIAETLGGDEETFARMMTQKARALGMTRTVYRNASGLPNDDQLTTARDQAVLGRAIQERFPRYYTYFATPSFAFNGNIIRNHNHLIGRVDGVDGIKTGYTRASGFNLLTSLHRDGKYLVAVVLGGRSAAVRDARMRELISDKIAEASSRRTAPRIAEANAGVEARPAKPTPRFALAASSAVTAPAPTGSIHGPVVMTAPQPGPTPPFAVDPAATRQAQDSAAPLKPIAVKTIKVKLSNMRTAALPAPAPQPANDEAVSSLPIAPAGTAPVINPQPGVLGVLPASTVDRTAARTPLPGRGVATARAEAASEDTTKPDARSESRTEAPRSVQHTGWIIQVGAYDGENEAKEHLNSARSKAKRLLAGADAFTETFTKGDKTYYRARFAGLDKEQAEAACKRLKRNEMACLTIKN